MAAMGDMSADTFFVLRAADGSRLVDAFARDCTMYRFFTAVSRALAFSDCTNADVVQIVYHGIEYVYEGWQPGELFAYHAVSDATVRWEADYPEFDH